MEKPSWRVLMKENWRATWPILIIQILFIFLLILNIVFYFILYLGQDRSGLFITLNGFLIGFSFITTGFNFLHYKEHYHQMAVKYALPDYDRAVKHAIWWFIMATIIIVFSIVEWFAFYY